MLLLFLFAIVGTLIIALVTRNGQTTATMRVATVIQDCFIFILPAVATAIVVSSLPARLLEVDRIMTFPQFILAVMGLIVSIPAMNFIVKLNAEISLPESLGGLESWMTQAEERAQESVKLLLGSGTTASLIINLLIVALLAGMSEEIFFRGTLQRLIETSPVNIHCAIWLTAFLFSAFHMQFYGFVPRMLLGAYFGYLLYWSKSLWLPVTVHSMNNAIVVVSMWLGENRGEAAADSLNSWGEDSPMLILGSAILTVFVILHLYRNRSLESDKKMDE